MKKKVLIIMLAAVLVIATACGGSTTTGQQGTTAPVQKTMYSFATGSPGGVWEILGTAMVNVLNQGSLPTAELVAVTPNQVMQVPSMLCDGEVNFGLGMACMFERAYEGIEEFDGDPQKDIMQVCAMYTNIYGYLVPTNSPLNDINDITEKTVIASTATNAYTVKQLITATGKFDPSKADYRVMSYAQAADALNDGNADMIILTAYPYSGTLDSLNSTKGVKFLTVQDDVRARFDELYPKSTMTPVPANMYAGQTEDRYATTIYTVLYCSKNTPDDVVYDVCKGLIDNVDELTLAHPCGAYFTLDQNKLYLESGVMSKDRMHPGAVKYFEEQGVL